MPAIETRHDYEKDQLDESAVAQDPFTQFQGWFDAANAADVPEPNAMVVATASAEGRPSSRVVLMRGFDPKGFVFYTNYESRKGNDLAANPYASCVWFWQGMERQIRVEGSVEKVDPAESDDYWRGRPRNSKLGAWVSDQSQAVESRRALETELEGLKQRFPGEEIPRPPHWGGFRVVPTVVEFWQGRRSRLHDRIVYRRADRDAPWQIVRLAP